MRTVAFLAGFLIEKLGALLLIISFFSLGWGGVRFFFDQWGWIAATISALLFPITALIFPAVFGVSTGEWGTAGKMFGYFVASWTVCGIGSVVKECAKGSVRKLAARSGRNLNLRE